MSHLLTELRGRHTKADVDAALATVVVSVEHDVATIARRRDAKAPALWSPEAAALPRAVRAQVAPDVYVETPTSAARVRLLEAAATFAPVLEIHAPTISVGTHRGRLAIDLPRRIVRALGVDAAEPGDRFDRRFRHAFFDDEALAEEAAHAGLALVVRRGAWVVLERGPAQDVERAPPFSREVVRALAIAWEAERLRLESPPDRAVRAMRDRGHTAPRRGVIGRARLRRAIGWVDAAFTGGPNCFRRTLVELGLDAGAAEETLVFGLDVGRTGHVAFKDSEDIRFDVAFEIASGSTEGR